MGPRLARAIARAPLETGLFIGAALVSLYAVVAPLVVARYPPITDLPFHAAQIGTLRHYWDPAFHQHEQFEIHPLANPYLSMYVLGALLMLFLPMMTAVKIAAAVMVALVPAGLAVMFHGMKKSPLLGLLGLGLCWGNLTNWGFLNFVGALGLFAMTVGTTLLLVDRPTRGRQVALALTLLALFATHVFRYPFALSAVVGTAVVMYPATRRIRPIVAPLAPAVVFFLVWLWARPKALRDDIGPLTLHMERFKELWGTPTGAFVDPAERRAYDGFFEVALAVAVVCVAAAIVDLLRGKARRDAPAWDAGVTVVPLACAAVFLGLFLVLPMNIGVWWYVYPREATAAVFVATLTLALAWGGLTCARVVVDNYARFDAVTGDFAAIVEEIPKAPKLMYLIFDHGGSTRTGAPFIHLPAYVQGEKGGWLSFHFAVWGLLPIMYRPRDEPGAVVPPEVPARWEWTPQRFDVHRNGAFFDWFLVRQRSSPARLFAADPSIEPVDHIGTWWLYRRRLGEAAGSGR
jgi:hypothetical protein